MNQINPIVGKYLAARALYRMVRWLKNWREVWSAYRNRLPLPPLQFRSGFTLHHKSGDEPLLLMYEIFVDGCYSRNKITDGVIIDLGANIGAATLTWASQSEKVTVHAYEPSPKTNQTLKENILANNLGARVSVYNEAVGREKGTIQLRTDLPSMEVTSFVDSLSAAGTCTTVPMVDLNEVIRRAGGDEIALLKIDTEGAEADILEGASPGTLRLIKQMVLEYHDSLCPDAYKRCKRVLDEAGFTIETSPINDHQGLLYAHRV
jgi:FkbM family methyltransferase